MTDPKMLHVLQHALGADEFGSGRQHRSHFATGEGALDYPASNDGQHFSGLFGAKQAETCIMEEAA